MGLNRHYNDPFTLSNFAPPIKNRTGKYFIDDFWSLWPLSHYPITNSVRFFARKLWVLWASVAVGFGGIGLIFPSDLRKINYSNSAKFQLYSLIRIFHYIFFIAAFIIIACLLSSSH